MFSHRQERSFDFSVKGVEQVITCSGASSKLNNTITMRDNFIIKVNIVYSLD